jgi:hypothetical protein
MDPYLFVLFFLSMPACLAPSVHVISFSIVHDHDAFSSVTNITKHITRKGGAPYLPSFLLFISTRHAIRPAGALIK